MTRIKHVSTLFLALGLTAGLAACAPAGSNDAGEGDTAAECNVGISMPTRSLERWINDGEGLKEKLEAKDCTVDLQYADDKTDQQISQIQNQVAGGAKILVVAAIDGKTLHLLQTDAGSVGAARHVGTAAMLGLGAQWIAVTDADTVVPAGWLVIQLGFADAGYELVLGTVEPDAADLSAEHLARWHAEHRLTEGHPHIHGANMAFSARAYTAAGGFEPLHVHEDVQLVSRIRAAGAGWTATDRMRAVTSGRLDGRVPAGFSGYLRRLGA